MKINSEAFDEFIKNPEAKTVLQNFASSLENYINTYTDNVSRISTNYSNRIRDIDERINRMTVNINKEIESMRMKFARLEVYLSEMQALQLRIQNFAAGLQMNNQQNNNQ